MSCELYETALIEVAALGRSAEELAPKVREHLRECGNCRCMLATQRMLQGTIAEGIEQRVRVDVPASLAAGVRGRLGETNIASWGIRWQWAAAAAAVIFSLLVVRGSLERRTAPMTTSQIASTQPNPRTQDRKVESESSGNRAKPFVSGKGPSAASKGNTFAQPNMKALVPEEQRETIELVVREIRTGQLDGRVLQLKAKPETEELEVAPMHIEALETVSEDKELDPQKLANGQSRDSERSTK